MVQQLDMICRREMIRRQQAEDSLVQQDLDAARKVKEDAAGTMFRGKLAKKRMNRAVDHGMKQERENAERMRLEHAEKVRKAEDLKEQRKKKRMNRAVDH